MKTLCESFNEITIKRGEKFDIELAENPSTGHRWQFQVVSGKAAKVDDQFTPNNTPNTIGGVGTRKMTFKAVGKKTIVIQAKYKRAHERDSAGELTLKVNVR
tara:strand:+ start:763 stop:1068 length:306 start_codon:yes stop_codon:yes gene_type:complete